MANLRAAVHHKTFIDDELYNDVVKVQAVVVNKEGDPFIFYFGKLRPVKYNGDGSFTTEYRNITKLRKAA